MDRFCFLGTKTIFREAVPLGVFIFDGHCDVLYRLWQEKDPSLFFQKESKLHCSYERLRQGSVKVQTLAVFVPEHVPSAQKATEALKMITILHHHLLRKGKNISLIRPDSPWPNMKDDGHLYVLLTLEGAEPIGDDLGLLHLYYELGVSGMGLTWNQRNLVADGIGEPRPGGLSRFGSEVVKEMNRLKMAIDVSHLAEPAFWDVLELSSQPVMASHSNARRLCPHPRNLTDEQLVALFEQGGIVGINFVPFFLEKDREADLNSILRHIDHLLSLGGADHIGFGSDFDGTDSLAVPLYHSGHWWRLVEECAKQFTEPFVEKLFFTNWQNYYLRLRGGN